MSILLYSTIVVLSTLTFRLCSSYFMVYVDVGINSTGVDVLGFYLVRSATECAANCARLQCWSFLYDTQTLNCTLHTNETYAWDSTATSRTNVYNKILQYGEPVDCGDIECTEDCSGVFQISPTPGTSFDVYCDMTQGGPWTVIQRRFDGSVDFYRSWEEHKQGFGTVMGEHWLGLDNIHSLLSLGRKLYIDMEGWDGTQQQVTYDTFNIANESQLYRLSISGYSGTLEDRFLNLDSRPFSTYDSDNDDNDNRDCAAFSHAGWWFRNCANINLNGRYTTDSGVDDSKSMHWTYFYVDRRKPPLKKCTMKVK